MQTTELVRTIWMMNPQYNNSQASDEIFNLLKALGILDEKQEVQIF